MGTMNNETAMPVRQPLWWTVVVVVVVHPHSLFSSLPWTSSTPRHRCGPLLSLASPPSPPFSSSLHHDSDAGAVVIRVMIMGGGRLGPEVRSQKKMPLASAPPLSSLVERRVLVLFSSLVLLPQMMRVSTVLLYWTSPPVRKADAFSPGCHADAYDYHYLRTTVTGRKRERERTLCVGRRGRHVQPPTRHPRAAVDPCHRSPLSHLFPCVVCASGLRYPSGTGFDDSPLLLFLFLVLRRPCRPSQPGACVPLAWAHSQDDGIAGSMAMDHQERREEPRRTPPETCSTQRETMRRGH